MSRRRVVVTGMGLVSPLGVGVAHCWARLLAGDVGVGALEGAEFADLPSRVAARVPGGPAPWQWEGGRFVPAGDARTGGARFIAFALAAAAEAVADAGLAPAGGGGGRAGGGGGGARTFDPDRAGVAIGSGVGGISEIEAAAVLVHGEGGYRRLSPFFVPRVLVNMAAGHVSMAHGLRGPSHAVSTACATGGHAIGDGARFIAHGDADVMLVGGSDACISRLAVAGFCRMKALCADSNADPRAASRPFDAGAGGFVIGEGAGVLVLEEAGHAAARGARVLAQLAGYGLSGDAHHVCAPEPRGRGAERCMRAALADARVAARDVAYVNAHATSTELGDRAELDALCAVFGGAALDGSAADVVVSSTKGATGHLLGAAGAAEAIFAISALQSGLVPPSANLRNPLPAAPGVRIAGAGAPTPLARPAQIVISNSFGFGGTNASLVFARPDWRG